MGRELLNLEGLDSYVRLCLPVACTGTFLAATVIESWGNGLRLTLSGKHLEIQDSLQWSTIP